MNIYRIGRSAETITVQAGDVYSFRVLPTFRAQSAAITVTCDGKSDTVLAGQEMILEVPTGATELSVVSDSESLVRIEIEELLDLSDNPPL